MSVRQFNGVEYCIGKVKQNVVYASSRLDEAVRAWANHKKIKKTIFLSILIPKSRSYHDVIFTSCVYNTNSKSMRTKQSQALCYYQRQHKSFECCCVCVFFFSSVFSNSTFLAQLQHSFSTKKLEQWINDIWGREIISNKIIDDLNFTFWSSYCFVAVCDVRCLTEHVFERRMRAY